MSSFLIEKDEAGTSAQAEVSGAARKKKSARPGKKIALATLLVERGLFEQIDEAKRWIMAGKVLVNEQRLDKPGMKVSEDAQLRILGRSRYVSRGGYKLEATLEHFAINVTGQIAL